MRFQARPWIQVPSVATFGQATWEEAAGGRLSVAIPAKIEVLAVERYKPRMPTLQLHQARLWALQSPPPHDSHVTNW